ncbi:MAG: AAA family ATPase [Muribaculaceae bacterium]|nr:AAA family ATPase [Muribaculaceae bacterium]
MLYRKISHKIESHLKSGSDKIMVVEGARQVGKSFIIRYVGTKVFKNFVEINFVKDEEGPQLFKNLKTTEEIYLALSSIAGDKLQNYDNTLVFLDEIQTYPQYLTLLKFLREDKKYHFIASGSLLGVALHQTISIPIGSIIREKMYPLDFEEYLMANNVGKDFIAFLKEKFYAQESLPQEMHDLTLNHFKRYLLVGGLPEPVNSYLESHNIVNVRKVQNEIHNLYGVDASRYEKEFSKKLLIRTIYNLIPSRMENVKKRFVFKDIQGLEKDRYSRYENEFEYLVASGISLNVKAISNPIFPLEESMHKNLFKLYMNDVGLLTSQLYSTNIQPIIESHAGINLGSVYENAVAEELAAHDLKLFYYDNRKKGEVDFMINDYENLSILPLEVKSGKDYKRHVAISNLLQNKEYNIKYGIVLSNNREVETKGNIIYMPVYYSMFLGLQEIKQFIF